MRNRDRRSDDDGSEEILRHEFRHADAAVRCRIARQITGMQSCPRHDAHEVWHRRTLEVRARRFRILFYVNIGDDHFSGRVHIVSEQTGDMVLILLSNLKAASRSVESLAASGQL